jgi:hypothetical protein
MTAVENGLRSWVESVATIAYRWREPGTTVRDVFEDSRPDLSDRRVFETSVADRLKRDPGLVDAWQRYSWDKRTSRGPYFDGLDVGFFDGDRRDVIEHQDRASACADFLFREASWVLLGRRAEPT